MRRIKLKDWVKKPSSPPKNRSSKDRPTPDWKLSNSIKYIQMRDGYLKEKEILVKKGKRKYRLNI